MYSLCRKAGLDTKKRELLSFFFKWAKAKKAAAMWVKRPPLDGASLAAFGAAVGGWKRRSVGTLRSAVVVESISDTRYLC